MASPFNVFRKHQKVLIATLGLLAMIAFVILPTILQQMGVHGGGSNPVVVRSKYGDLTESDLQQMRYRRQRLISFLERAVDAAGFDHQSTLYRKMAIEREFGGAGEESTVDIWLMVQKAKQLGMTVSDNTVSDFIASLTDNRLTRQQFAQLYKNLHMSENEVFDSLQDELLARELQSSFLMTLAGTPPGWRWEYYQRLNRKMTIEVAGIQVADYLSQVEDPSDEELEEFFEKHKDNLASPNSPEPGFRVPAKVSLEYVKTNISTLVDSATVTDEEIEDFYNKHRDEWFLKTELPGLPGLDEEKTEEANGSKSLQEESASKTNSDDATVGENALPTQTPAKSQTETPDGNGEPSKPQQSPTTDREEPQQDKPVDEESKNSSRVYNQTFRLVSMAEETSDEKKATNAVAKDSAPENETQATEQPDDMSSVKSQQNSNPEKTEQQSEEDAKYKSLEEVRSQIKNLLTAQKRARSIETILQPTHTAVSNYRSDLNLYRATGEEEGLQEPEKPDFETIAKKNDLSFHDTDLLSAVEFGDMDIGRSIVDGRQPFIDYIFSTSNLYRPKRCSDLSGNVYLFWKTDSNEERVPKLDEEGVREQVLAAWKIAKARKIARDEAEKLVEKIHQSDKSLAEAIGSRINVYESGPFSWVTRAPVGPQGQPRLMLGSVEHVDHAGEDFMRAVYNLQVGQIGTAMNQPQTAVYIIQLQKATPSDKVLMVGFKADPYSEYSSVALSDQIDIFKNWRDSIRKDANLKWERKAVRVSARNQ